MKGLQLSDKEAWQFLFNHYYYEEELPKRTALRQAKRAYQEIKRKKEKD